MTSTTHPADALPLPDLPDTLLQVIQTLNSNPYSLTKSECIRVVEEMHEAALSTPPAAPTLFNGLTQAETDASASVNGLTAAPTTSPQADHSPDGGNMVEQQAGEVTELRAALWHVKNTAKSLADAQVIALEALAAFEAKKAGA